MEQKGLEGLGPTVAGMDFDVRILVFEYGDTRMSSLNELLSQKSLELYAENLLQAISADRKNREEKSDRPIVFVAHGYGGLICEQVCFGAPSIQARN